MPPAPGAADGPVSSAKASERAKKSAAKAMPITKAEKTLVQWRRQRAHAIMVPPSVCTPPRVGAGGARVRVSPSRPFLGVMSRLVPRRASAARWRQSFDGVNRMNVRRWHANDGNDKSKKTRKTRRSQETRGRREEEEEEERECEFEQEERRVSLRRRKDESEFEKEEDE